MKILIIHTNSFGKALPWRVLTGMDNEEFDTKCRREVLQQKALAAIEQMGMRYVFHKSRQAKKGDYEHITRTDVALTIEKARRKVRAIKKGVV